jgi:hypothetical protein
MDAETQIKGHSAIAFKVLQRLVAVGFEVAEGIGVNKAEKGVVKFKVCPDLRQCDGCRLSLGINHTPLS